MANSLTPRPRSRSILWLILVGLVAAAIAFILFWRADTTPGAPTSATPTNTAAPASPSPASVIPSATNAPTATVRPTPTPQPSATPLLTTAPSPTAVLPPTGTPSPTAKSTADGGKVADATLRFDGKRAYQFVLEQEAIGPRPTGSEAGWKMGDTIIQQLKLVGWDVSSQEFIFKGVRGRNVIGKGGSGPVIIIGAHYDTRPAADQDPDPSKHGEPILGANDGGSGVAVLLELAHVLDRERLKVQVWLVCFDAEDRGRLDGWPFSVGAVDVARRLTVGPEAMVLVDMIGDADQQIYYEGHSNPDLAAEIWTVADELGYGDFFIPQVRHTLIDDHLPFVERGIPAVDIIDFDYPYWHTVADTSDKVSADSLERVGRTLQAWLERKK
jgi:glutaminyl-peptide cyclotransferase